MMLRCNLAILLAERKLRITKVSVDTGISRTTLTALCNNYSQGIQFDTLNELCLYLDVTADELITFVPVDIQITDMTLSPYTGSGHRQAGIFANIRDRRRDRQGCYLVGYLVEHTEDNKINQIDVVIDLPDDSEKGEDMEFIKKSFQMLPRSFYPDLEQSLREHLLKLYPQEQLTEEVNIIYTWSDDLTGRSRR